MSRTKRVFLGLLSLLLIGSGINHFLSIDFYLPMMPDYLPWHRELIWISGVIEIVLGVALWIDRYRKLAAWGCIALMLAVFPANIHMYLHPEKFPDVPEIGLLIRLPMQGLFILWAYWFTR